MVAVRKPFTTLSLRCARHDVPVRRTRKRKPKSICPAPNRGGKKELVAREPVMFRHQSGVAAAWCLDQSRAIIPRKFPSQCAVSEIKTKAFVDLVRKQTDAEKVLIVSDSFDDKTYKSARNVKPVKLATAADVNTEQLLAFQKILVTSKALEKLAERIK